MLLILVFFCSELYLAAAELLDFNHIALVSTILLIAGDKKE